MDGDQLHQADAATQGGGGKMHCLVPFTSTMALREIVM